MIVKKQFYRSFPSGKSNTEWFEVGKKSAKSVDKLPQLTTKLNCFCQKPSITIMRKGQLESQNRLIRSLQHKYLLKSLSTLPVINKFVVSCIYYLIKVF